MSTKDYALSTLGKSPTRDAKRDAIHIPVVVATATMSLRPGTPVTLHRPAPTGADLPFIAQASMPGESHGIVDPFRVRPVDRYDTAWIFVKPSLLSTNVTHEWFASGIDNPPGNITSPEEEQSDEDMCCPSEEDMCCPGEGW